MIQDISGVATAVGALIAAVALIVGALSLWELKRQRVRQFETIFVERYWALMDRLSLAAITGLGRGD